MTKLPQNLLHSEPGPRTDGLKDTLSLRLNPLFAHILTPPTIATMPAQTWHPFTFFQPGIFPQRCYQVATALTLSRRSQQREGEALPLLHALTIAHAPDKVNRKTSPGSLQTLFSHDRILPANGVEAQTEKFWCLLIK